MTLSMLDLFAGLGGAHAAMTDRGWDVVSVDNLEWLKPTVVADILNLPLIPSSFDLIWASPPCTFYSRKHLPWYPNEPDPDLSLFNAAERIITEFEPRFWVIENVQGAVRYHGKATCRVGSRLLWTNIPPLPRLDVWRKRSVFGSDPLCYWKRSKIPYVLSEAVALAVESAS